MNRFKTPYEKLWLPLMNSRVKQHEGLFDLFVSYASEDSDIARYISEALSVHGANIWFSEYTTFRWQDSIRSLDEQLRTGIALSRNAICLNSPNYIGSAYCQEEASYLISALGDSRGHVWKINLGDSIEYSHSLKSLDYAEELEFDGNKRRFISVILNKLNVENVNPYEWNNTTAFPPLLQSTGYHVVNARGWLTIEEYSGNEIIGTLRFIHHSRAVKMSGQLEITQLHQKRDNDYMRENERRELLFSKAAPKTKGWGLRLIGIHILWILGLKHMAFTWRSWRGLFLREYKVILPVDNNILHIYEFKFRFNTKDFRIFCSLAQKTEELVSSLQPV